jgi:glyoxylase-like metal-dependent hydrolase (beta-lactamase superfamily II)
MSAKRILDGLWQIALGPVNAFLIDRGDLVLIDTGMPGDDVKIAAALDGLGKSVADIRHIIVTHCHPDHAGGAAAIGARTGAAIYMHPADAALVRLGQAKRPMTAAPGILRTLLFNLFVKRAPGSIPAFNPGRELNDGDTLPLAGGLRVVHVPGHCAGQIAVLWPSAGVLFAADACSNQPGFGLSLGYEDLALGRQSLARLSRLDFETACFGHGQPITTAAATTFRDTFGH